MMPTPAASPEREIVSLDGHLLDSMVLPKVLDAIVDAGATYEILELDVGATRIDRSRIRLELSCRDEGALAVLLEGLQVHGVNVEGDENAELVEADQDGVLPEAFYSTTNFATAVRLDGHWVNVERPEMDCAIVVGPGDTRALTVPMHRARAGDRVVVGMRGVRVERPVMSLGGREFEFMSSDVSSEKPKGVMIERVAASIRRGRQGGGAVLAVCGPAVVHTGAAPALAAMVREGWIQVFFAGNGFATHDIESSVLGTSLGIPLSGDVPSEHGHANHLRVINTVRRFGSIRAAVAAGWLRSGVLFECVGAGVPFVLGGSVRDDGPLPDVITDTVAAADVMRGHLGGVEVALMLASTLHAIATGNLLPASVETFCVDINQAVLTKLADRGTHQALGVVTDVGLFATELADVLCGPLWRASPQSSTAVHRPGR
jgi:lysine-ketoglutarate reductase/saccharopine dehydrogenase-like protein (TIGR00300 family)